MIKIKKIDHVAICVEDIEKSARLYADRLGLSASAKETSDDLQTEAVFMNLGETALELVSPLAGNQGLLKFLAKKGPGLHHIALEVESIEGALAFLKAIDVPLIDEVARLGAGGSKVAFLHPRALGGVLVELVEASKETL